MPSAVPAKRSAKATSKKAAGKREAPVPEAEQQRLQRKVARQGRRRDEIVRAAEEIARTAGADGFTADDVARALSMSTPSVFYYFPGGLLELRAAVALRRFYGRMDAAVDAARLAPTGTAALTGWVRAMLRGYLADPEGCGQDLEIMQRGTWGTELVQAHIAKLNDAFTIVEQKLEADRAAGRLHPDIANLRRMAMLVNQLALGLLVGDQMRRRSGGTSKHALEALTDDLCALLERGLRKR